MPRALRLLSPLALALLLSAAFVVLRTVPAHASGNQETIFQDDNQLHANTMGTLKALRGLGVQRVRLFVVWSSIAPSPSSANKPHGFSPSNPNSYPAQNWTYYDNVVRDAKQLGIGVDFTVTGGAPRWATGSGFPGGNLRGTWKPSASEFGAFVSALGKRYGGVHYWAIWNEPNYGQWLAPQAVNNGRVEVAPGIYRGLVDAAWGALHATGHGNDTFLFGETAPRGQTVGGQPGNFDGMVPLRFVRAMYCVDSSFNPLRGGAAAQRGCPTNANGSNRFRGAHPALFQATGFAAHLYPQNQNPVTQTWPNPPPNQYADLPNLPAVLRTLDRVNGAYGSHRRFNVYNTEYGYQTHPPGLAGKASPATAATWINWGEYLSWRSSRLATYMQYGLVDPIFNNFPSALEDKHGRHKPAFDTFLMPIYLPATSTKHGRSLEVWGCARPAYFVGPSSQRQVQIQFQRGSHGSFKTVKTVSVNRVGYFDVGIKFAASGSVRLSWFDPLVPVTVHSRTQTISIH